MTEQIVIILYFREEKAEEFERLFEAEILPLWRRFKAEGKFHSASLARIFDDHIQEGHRNYMLVLEVPSRKEHEEFDTHPHFLGFLEKARAMQPEEPTVWLAEPLFRV